jgi:3-dehydroquinate synthase
MRLQVALGERGYDILIGRDVLREAGAAIGERLGRRPLVLVVDGNLRRTGHPARLAASLRDAGLAVSELEVTPGEGSKSWDGIVDLVGRLLELGVDRATVVVAMGGGVVGDLAGFAAAITLRGLDLVQVPTTLLSQVDSSIGGKTGINTAHGKNLVGAFHQPRLVLVDTATLDDLPARELRAGYAEVVKHAFIKDSAFFDWLEENGAALLAGEPAARAEAIRRSLEIKAAVVAADERETTGERALLNFGHTFGHAFEALAGYGQRLLHGEAVSLGMVKAFRLSQRLGLCPATEAARAIGHLARLGLPVRLDDHLPGIAADAVLAAMRSDKKAAAGRLAFVLCRRIGEAFVTRDVPEEALRAVLQES